ncbi:MAG: DUF5683 domain-containing protein [Bacteroidales bacterium]|nr:DUF5683 domain-containing protein [Bacteroidales bacterium]
MNVRALLRIVVLSVILLAGLSGRSAHAQFRSQAFTQNYNEPNDTTFQSDTTDKLFSFSEFFEGMGHKRRIRIGTSFAGSVIFVGCQQIYNKDYWKLPIIYGGIGAGLGVGIYNHLQYKQTGELHNKQWATAGFVGAGVFYWAALLDGVICYDRTQGHLPGRATLYSLLVPGLGQAYNGEFWKVPVYDLLMAGSVYFFLQNRTNYLRYRGIYIESMEPGYSGRISSDQALYYRDEFRKYRDYSVLAMVGFYLLQVIDANVFSYMRNFEISEDITMDMSLGVINPDLQLASYGGGAGCPGGGGFNSPVLPRQSSFGRPSLAASSQTTLFGGNAVGLTFGFRF